MGKIRKRTLNIFSYILGVILSPVFWPFDLMIGIGIYTCIAGTGRSSSLPAAQFSYCSDMIAAAAQNEVFIPMDDDIALSDEDGEKYRIATETNPLFLREEPSISSKVLTKIPKGETIIVTEINENWGRTVYDALWGWVNLNYCEKEDQFSVWISTSEDAYSYHLDRNCPLLQKTTSPIKAVSLEYAKSHGHADPCNKCAGGQ